MAKTEKWYDVTVTRRIVVSKPIKARSENDARKKYASWPIEESTIDGGSAYEASRSNPFVRSEITNAEEIEALEAELLKVKK